MLFTEWEAYRGATFEYKKGETWDRLLCQGLRLLERFAHDNRVHLHDPHRNLEVGKLRTTFHETRAAQLRVPIPRGEGVSTTDAGLSKRAAETQRNVGR